MSFFEEDDPPTRRAPRPRRAAPAGGPDVDPQTLWVRRAVALVAAIVVLILLVVGVRACQNSAHESALRDYNREAGALIEQSDTATGDAFFETLTQAAADSPEDLQADISSLTSEADRILDQAIKLETPDDLKSAQQSLLIALELRRDGLDFIARRITTALGSEGDVADKAIEEIAGQMQSFLASDVLILSRVHPITRDALKEADISADPLTTSRFLKDLGWLDPPKVADALGTRLSEGGENRDANEEPAPGLHGTGLQSVAVGETTLQPAGVANRVSIGGDLTFKVTFQNQGENDEFDVEAVVTLQGQSGKPIKGRKKVDQVAQGAEATANVVLPKKPTANEVYEVTVEVKAVPGEEKTDNNKQTYNVLFTP